MTMSEYRSVDIIPYDWDSRRMTTVVAVGVPYPNDDFDDPRIYYYFEDEAEFERAKLGTDEFEFQIVEEN